MLDLSEGGLSVLTALQADQGESLTIRFKAPNGQPIEVEALLWHSRESEESADSSDSSARELAEFRIRVKQIGGPRTRVLTLGAKSSEEARALAATSLGDSWELLEIVASGSPDLPRSHS